MLLIPAIDIKDGKCVRLRQGRMQEATVFSDDPLAMAKRWVDVGARRLHIVDLNGAHAGKPVNAAAIQSIRETFPGIPVQVGGGIRDEDTIQAYIDMGVQYVILGTKAVNAPHFVSDVCAEFPGHIIVGLDAKDGKVAIDGWSKLSGHDVIDLAKLVGVAGQCAPCVDGGGLRPVAFAEHHIGAQQALPSIEVIAVLFETIGQPRHHADDHLTLLIGFQLRRSRNIGRARSRRAGCGRGRGG